MILIADSGSTKVDWCLIDNENVIAQEFTTGMNALLLTEGEMAETIKNELLPKMDTSAVSEVYYYGAGCLFEDVCNNVKSAIKRNVPSAEKIEVHTDLLAAARALCGNEAGIACILGTGSNSCYYDGEKIVDNVSPLGYILGDEGSGAVLGKLLVGDVLKKQMPQELCDKFFAETGLDAKTIIQNVYKKPGANRFLASLSPFLAKNIEEPSIHRLVLNAFKSFFVRNITGYKGYKELPVNFVGSVANYYEPLLREAAKPLDITIGKILKSPMEGLIKFHQSK